MLKGQLFDFHFIAMLSSSGVKQRPHNQYCIIKYLDYLSVDSELFPQHFFEYLLPLD